MKIKIIKDSFIPCPTGRTFAEAGSIVDVDAETAQAMFAGGSAVPTDKREKVKVSEIGTIENRDPKPRRGKK